METGLIRMGVFVDGGFLQQMDIHYREHHPRAAGIRPGGLVAWCRDQVARRTGRDLGLCRVVDTWCFTVAGGEGPNDRALRRDGFVVQEVGGGSRGLEVALSVEALGCALRGGLDVAVLVVSSTAYVPLARKLAAAGVAVMVPAFQLQVPDRKGGWRRQWTAPALLEEAAWPVVLSRIIDEAEDRDPLIRGLFFGRPQHEAPKEQSREPADHTGDAPAGKALSQKDPPRSNDAPEGILKGRIADLRERMGFLVEEWNGRRLFFHYSAVEDGMFLDLEVGDPVEYERGMDPRNRPAGQRVRKLDLAAPLAEAEPEPGTDSDPSREPATVELEPGAESDPSREPATVDPEPSRDQAEGAGVEPEPEEIGAEAPPTEETKPEPEPEPINPVIGTPTEPNLEAVTKPTDPSFEAVTEPGTDSDPSREPATVEPVPEEVL